jgi:asparagine N-glycosylation enzyme membrane subunit Stt3
MGLPRKDLIATALVAVAVIFYLLWTIEGTLPGMSDTSVTAAGILVLGFVASAIAVVPGFDNLVHGNKTYLAITSLLGVVALVAGVQVMMTSSGVALTVVIATMIALWAISTSHHLVSDRKAQVPARVETKSARRSA